MAPSITNGSGKESDHEEFNAESVMTHDPGVARGWVTISFLAQG